MVHLATFFKRPGNPWVLRNMTQRGNLARVSIIRNSVKILPQPDISLGTFAEMWKTGETWKTVIFLRFEC